MDATSLATAVAGLAACVLLARHWPAPGSRDEAAMALAGMLLRGGWDPHDADVFLERVARSARDEEWVKRAKGIATAAAQVLGKRTSGAPTLERLLRGDGRRVVATVRAWLGLVGNPPESSRTAPGAPGATPAVPPVPPVVPARIGTRLSKVEAKLLRPPWPGRIYRGKCGVLDGDRGCGKTNIAIDLCARYTTGREMPGGSTGLGHPTTVVYFTAEDDPADTLKPRPLAAGGDPDRFIVVTAVEFVDADGQTYERLPTLSDTALLEQVIQENEAGFVVYDPLMAFLPEHVNSWRDQDARAPLRPVARVAERTDAAIPLIRHLNKAAGSNPLSTRSIAAAAPSASSAPPGWGSWPPRYLAPRTDSTRWRKARPTWVRGRRRCAIASRPRRRGRRACRGSARATARPGSSWVARRAGRPTGPRPRSRPPGRCCARSWRGARAGPATVRN